MVSVRNPFRRQDSMDATTAPTVHQSPSSDDVKSPSEEKDDYGVGDVKASDPADVPFDQLADRYRLENGKERPIEVSKLFDRRKCTCSPYA